MAASTSKHGPNVIRGTGVEPLYDDAVNILMPSETLDEILKFSESQTDREIGGFLIGRRRGRNSEYVAANHFLPATETDSRAASLTFTHDTWAALTREVDQRYPDEVVVGWHHTHPNIGDDRPVRDQ